MTPLGFLALYIAVSFTAGALYVAIQLRRQLQRNASPDDATNTLGIGGGEIINHGLSE